MRQERGADPARYRGRILALGCDRVAAALLAAELLAKLHVRDELGRLVLDALVLEVADDLHLGAAALACPLVFGHQDLGDLALERRRELGAAGMLALFLQIANMNHRPSQSWAT